MEVNYTEGMWGTWQKTNAKASTSLWGLDRINQKSLPLDNNINHNFTGYGVDVYILDSGILSSHEQFTHGDRAICSFNAIAKDNTDCYDGTGHGTHVAGSVGGTSYGVTKGVQLLAVKVLDSNGSGLASRVIAGIDHVVNKKKSRIRPTVVNMSFGGKQSLALNEAVDAAVEEGIVFVASAGNDARPACQQSPASSQLAITVGASNQRDRGALYSNFGKCIDIFG